MNRTQARRADVYDQDLASQEWLRPMQQHSRSLAKAGIREFPLVEKLLKGAVARLHLADQVELPQSYGRRAEGGRVGDEHACPATL